VMHRIRSFVRLLPLLIGVAFLLSIHDHNVNPQGLINHVPIQRYHPIY